MFEFRNLPGVDAHGILARIEDYAYNTLAPKMRAEHPNGAIEIVKLAMAPALDASEQAAITQLVRALTQDREVRKVGYATEAGLFERAGVPSIVCGPGDIQQAHKADEFVALEQIEACDRFLRKVVRSLSLETAPA
jgi:acetylornithine deacetylase